MKEQFEMLEKPVYRFLLRLTGCSEAAAELAQETLLKGWQQREGLRDPDALQTWLFRIALHISIDGAKKKAVTRAREAPLQDGQHPLARDPTPAGIVAARELGERIWELVGELPDRQRQVFHLRIVEGFGFSEIAEVLDISAANARNTLAIARRTIRERMSPLMQEGANSKP